jgi:hypothetical protein
VHLDPNHTNFIILDDQCGGEFCQEIPFRIMVESEFRTNEFHNLNKPNNYDRSPRSPLSPVNRKFSSTSMNESYTSSGLRGKTSVHEKYHSKFNIKMIQICVQGGFDTLLVIQESLKAQVPILILAVCKVFVSFFLRYFFVK